MAAEGQRNSGKSGALGGLCVAAVSIGMLAAGPCAARPASGPNGTIVHTALGGEILGYDVDRNGSEGILAEYVSVSGGKVNVALETFDQQTGNIIKIVKQIEDTNDDFVAQNIVGDGIGLTLFQRSKDGFFKNAYRTLNPLTGNRLTGKWTPPLGKDELLSSISQNQGSAATAVMGFQNNGNHQTFLFSSDVAANTFGPRTTLVDPIFDGFPAMAFDSKTNKAVVAGSIGCRQCIPELALVDLVRGTVDEFQGIGFGTVNGIAVDSEDGIAVTATEIDFTLEFYNLKTKIGFPVTLRGATSQAQSGTDVEYDPVNKLFLVGQPFTSTGLSGSSIQVFDTKGNFVESVDGLNLPVSPTLIAINPHTRTGFVWVTPTGTELQGFSY
ncbi:MAG TPA: hypothetical protein VGF62_07120 [Rhizomicrobium sp.]